jgi:hypothetical protein
VLDYSGLVSLLCPLSLGQGQWSVSQPPAVSVLWWFADYFSVLQYHLTLDVAHWLRIWTLWTATCPISGSALSTTHCRPFCLSSLCLLKVHMEISFLLFPPLQCTFSNSTLQLCVSFQSLVYCLVFWFFGFFCVREGSLAQGAMLVYPGVTWGIPRDAFAHLFGLPNVSQTGLELASGGSRRPPVYSV